MSLGMYSMYQTSSQQQGKQTLETWESAKRRLIKEQQTLGKEGALISLILTHSLFVSIGWFTASSVAPKHTPSATPVVV